MEIKRIFEVANKESISLDIEIYVEDGQTYVTIGTENATGFTTKVTNEDDIVNAFEGYLEDTLEELV